MTYSLDSPRLLLRVRGVVFLPPPTIIHTADKLSTFAQGPLYLPIHKDLGSFFTCLDAWKTVYHQIRLGLLSLLNISNASFGMKPYPQLHCPLLESMFLSPLLLYGSLLATLPSDIGCLTCLSSSLPSEYGTRNIRVVASLCFHCHELCQIYCRHSI